MVILFLFLHGRSGAAAISNGVPIFLASKLKTRIRIRLPSDAENRDHFIVSCLFRERCFDVTCGDDGRLLGERPEGALQRSRHAANQR